MRLIDADALPISFDGHTISVWKKDLDAAPTVNPYEWIRVTDRLPEDFKTVLALCKDGGMFVGRRTSWHRWEIFTAMKSTRVVNRTVTRWMPLPSPPKNGGAI